MSINKTIVQDWDVEVERPNGWRETIRERGRTRGEIRVKLRTNMKVSRIHSIKPVK